MRDDIVLLDGARTPFGNFNGALQDISAIDLGVVAAREAMKRSGVNPEDVDHVVFGNVLQTSSDAILLARHVALKSGVPIETPALTVNRLCGSGMQAIVSGSQLILLEEAKVVLVGGTENMSQAPFVIRGARKGLRLGSIQLEDMLWEALLDTYCGCTMAMTAENVAKRYGLTREEVDAHAAESQRRALKAIEDGRLAEEIVPVEVSTPKGTVVVSRDEHPRPTTVEALAKLPARFVEGGVVTAGNASGINDGAAAGVLTTAKYAAERGLRPIGRLVSWGIVGVEPEVMGLGPVPAIRMALKRAGMTLDQMDLIEINEAFSAQYLGCQRELGFDLERANVNGGAVAIGHPLAASGMRLVLTMLYELRRRKKKYGVASLCIGGGQGIATVWEAL
ncbi:MAG: acetyl-CoA C-acetyltransferase [Alicyclobacillaceae bacterium]|nr:acetyl-CoA C-acetyltransferase [Alicyclobacillaceae bacterium]